MPGVPLRVHIAAVQEDGRGEPGTNFSTLVVDPALAQQADALHVLRPLEGADTTIQFLEEAAGTRTRFKVHAVDFRQPAAAAGVVGGIVQSYGIGSGSTFLYNVSSGPRDSVLVAFLAAQFWPVQLYRAELDFTTEPNPVTNEWRYARTLPLPTPTRRHVGDGARACLRQLAGGLPVRQRALIDHLKERRIIAPEDDEASEDLSAQAADSQFRKHGRELLSLGFATKLGPGRNCKWQITGNGANAATVMGLAPA